MDKDDAVHIWKGIWLSQKTGCSTDICSNRNGLGDDLTKWCSSEKDKHPVMWLIRCAVLSGFSHFPLFATPWTVAHQAPLSMGFSRQEYWRSLVPKCIMSSWRETWLHGFQQLACFHKLHNTACSCLFIIKISEFFGLLTTKFMVGWWYNLETIQ